MKKPSMQVIVDNEIIDANDSKKKRNRADNCDIIACVDGVLQVIKCVGTISYHWYGTADWSSSQVEISTIHNFYKLPDGRIGLHSRNTIRGNFMESMDDLEAASLRSATFRIFDSLDEIKDNDWERDEEFFNSFEHDDDDCYDEQDFCSYSLPDLKSFIAKCKKRWTAQQVAQELEGQ